MLASVAELLLLGLTTASIFYFSACLFAAKHFASLGPKESQIAQLPPVTILIPLCGADFKAYENYASFCRLDYPVYQIVFGAQDPKDSSIPVIRKLISDFPQNDIKLVVKGGSIGQNPKVNNLHNILAEASYDLIVIADSDIRVGEDYLASIIPPLLDEGVGLVTCFYRAGAAPNIASRIEALGMTADFAPGVLVARLMEGMTFALGATMATSRTKLESIGGLNSIADYLADDYMLGHLMAKAGLKVHLSPYIVETMLPPMNLEGMIKHQIRWGRGIRSCRPKGYFGSIVTHGPIAALAYLIANQGTWLSFLLFFLTVSLRMSVAWRVGVLLLDDSILKKNIWLLPLRDIIGFFVWCMSLFGRRVEWRARSFEIAPGGILIPVGKLREKK